ncbi:hypothetical protein HYU23_01075 [Candidatus Woesearchaeota archaeon]|nr:hypothetical protein [Candidatus Woesearchaeota archaeon]
MRNNEYLRVKLEEIWINAFSDIEKKNNINIMFKGKWKNKFGHIKKLNNGDSEIVINGYFKDDNIPDFIINLTIAHELVHYSHGFNSPLPKLFKHPHKGGIVNKDLKKRGFTELIKLERKWVKNEWREIVKKEFKPRKINNNSLFRWF